MEGGRGAVAISRLQNFITPSARELDFLSSIPGEDRVVEAKASIDLNDTSEGFFLLLDGWVANSIVLENGAERINSLNLPGDMLGMASFVMATPFDQAHALTRASLRWVPAAVLRDIYVSFPRLAATIMLVAQEERAGRNEWNSLQFLPADKRLAAFLFRIGERLARLNLISPHNMTIPLLQRELAEVVGVTPVYISKLVGRFERDKLIATRRGQIDLINLSRLKSLSNLDEWKVTTPSWLPVAS